MRVRIIIPKYRCRLGHDHVFGDECDLAEHVAVKLIRLGIAEAVRERVIETATVAPRENTARKRKPRTITRRHNGA